MGRQRPCTGTTWYRVMVLMGERGPGFEGSSVYFLMIFEIFWGVFLLHPSEILLGIERAALFTWEVKPNPSFLGNIFVNL